MQHLSAVVMMELGDIVALFGMSVLSLSRDEASLVQAVVEWF